MFVNKTEPGAGTRIDLPDGSYIWIVNIGRRGRFNLVGIEAPECVCLKRVDAAELQRGLDDAELEKRWAD